MSPSHPLKSTPLKGGGGWGFMNLVHKYTKMYNHIHNRLIQPLTLRLKLIVQLMYIHPSSVGSFSTALNLRGGGEGGTILTACSGKGISIQQKAEPPTYMYTSRYLASRARLQTTNYFVYSERRPWTKWLEWRNVNTRVSEQRHIWTKPLISNI